jgi:hypothetical protein
MGEDTFCLQRFNSSETGILILFYQYKLFQHFDCVFRRSITSLGAFGINNESRLCCRAPAVSLIFHLAQYRAVTPTRINPLDQRSDHQRTHQANISMTQEATTIAITFAKLPRQPAKRLALACV